MTDSKSGLPVWRLRKGMDRRFRAGHPWVYSNELAQSPKGLEPGAGVELQDAAGKFLARGYGNPHSLIAFRALSRDSENLHPHSFEEVTQQLIRAGKLRNALGLTSWSYRLCFGEGDQLPGWIIDRYLCGKNQVFVVQAHTAGADRWNSKISEILKNYVQTTGFDWEKTAIVLRNDLTVRKLEGLKEEKVEVIREVPGLNLEAVQIEVRPVLDEKGKLIFDVDLIRGQKTGFFLDQSSNIELAALRFQSLPFKKIRILDLCTYVGQWSAQLGRVFQEKGCEVEVVAVDASQQALEKAKKNIERQKVICETVKTDVLKGLTQFEDQFFDLVISDPPALISSRKDIPTGTHAYLQLATQVFRVLKSGGGVVCCSCSGLLEEESFTQVLTKAAQRNQTQIHWVGRGSQGADHPMLTEFPEGRYLKGYIGIKN